MFGKIVQNDSAFKTMVLMEARCYYCSGKNPSSACKDKINPI